MSQIFSQEVAILFFTQVRVLRLKLKLLKQKYKLYDKAYVKCTLRSTVTSKCLLCTCTRVLPASINYLKNTANMPKNKNRKMYAN